MQQVKTATREIIPSWLEHFGLGIIMQPMRVCIVRLKINNEDFFYIISRLKSHIILFLYRLMSGGHHQLTTPYNSTQLSLVFSW